MAKLIEELTKEEIQEANRALALVQKTQDEYWQALLDLEGALNIDVDSTRDFQGVSVEDLLAEENEEADNA